MTESYEAAARLPKSLHETIGRPIEALRRQVGNMLGGIAAREGVNIAFATKKSNESPAEKQALQVMIPKNARRLFARRVTD